MRTLQGIICVIGKKTIINYQHLEPTVVLRQKGSDCINEASRLRGDKVRASDGAIIHSAVDRRTLMLKLSVISKKVQPNCSPTRNLRSQTSSFPCETCSQW